MPFFILLIFSLTALVLWAAFPRLDD